eukprot:COSAG02_NODE_385_length_23394_cov_43.838807_3_plen_112_part_00
MLSIIMFCATRDGDEPHQCMLAAVRLAVWMRELNDRDGREPIASPQEALADLVKPEVHGSATGVFLEGTVTPRIRRPYARCGRVTLITGIRPYARCQRHVKPGITLSDGRA